ncbi:hypothetical protein VTI74DRAFT_8818 [Chaetomium olivicolor]
MAHLTQAEHAAAAEGNRKKLPPLPDFILEKMGGAEYVAIAHDVGFLGPRTQDANLGPQPCMPDTGTKAPSQAFITQQLKKQIAQGNYQALANARVQNLQDLQPNFTTLQNASDAAHAYATATNPSNGRKYQICASDSGWLWHYTVDIRHVPSAEDDKTTVTECVVQSGTYSKNGQFLGIAYQTFTNIPTVVTDLACSAMAMFVEFYFVRQYLLGALYEVALNAAVEAAAADAVAGGLMVNAAAASMAATILSGLAAGIVGVVVGIALFMLADFLRRSYGVTIDVYNWDTKSDWKIEDWYGDNAVVSQETAADGGWKKACLLPVQNSIPGPFGPIDTDQPVAQYAQYAYKNDNEWLEGLGVAMKIVSSNACKLAPVLRVTDKVPTVPKPYEIHRFADNRLGYQGNTNGSMADFYKNGNTWRPSGSYSYTGNIDGRPDLTVTLITNALNGTRAYNLEVHIGVEQSL